MKYLKIYEQLSDWTKALFSLGNYIMISTTNSSIPEDLLPYIIKHFEGKGSFMFNVLYQNDRYFVAEFDEGIKPYDVIRIFTTVSKQKIPDILDVNMILM